eukprot:6194356-Pleurochrysis_carterae.AAC.5
MAVGAECLSSRRMAQSRGDWRLVAFTRPCAVLVRHLGTLALPCCREKASSEGRMTSELELRPILYNFRCSSNIPFECMIIDARWSAAAYCSGRKI